MNYAAFEASLTPLDKLEIIGKKHYETYGKNLSYLQYLFLRNHNIDDNLEMLYSKDAITEQKRIENFFQEEAFSQTLYPKHFFSDNRTIEIEKLLRYVDIPSHQHDFIECAYIFCGKCVHNINGQDYLQEAGSFVTIPYGFDHILYPDENCLCLTLKIRNETFQKMHFPGMANFVYPLAFACGNDDFVRHCIVTIWEQQKDNLPYCEQIEEQLFQTMLLYIEQRFHDEMQYLVSGAKQDKQMFEILNYMLDNYQVITLESTANHFHYTPAYLSRMFHSKTGTTFSAIVKEFKLRQAAKLLLETNEKLNDICDEIGYKDTTQFIRSFKKIYGVTPIQYRKRRE